MVLGGGDEAIALADGDGCLGSYLWYCSGSCARAGWIEARYRGRQHGAMWFIRCVTEVSRGSRECRAGGRWRRSAGEVPWLRLARS